MIMIMKFGLLLNQLGYTLIFIWLESRLLQLNMGVFFTGLNIGFFIEKGVWEKARGQNQRGHLRKTGGGSYKALYKEMLKSELR